MNIQNRKGRGMLFEMISVINASLHNPPLPLFKMKLWYMYMYDVPFYNVQLHVAINLHVSCTCTYTMYVIYNFILAKAYCEFNAMATL